MLGRYSFGATRFPFSAVNHGNSGLEAATLRPQVNTQVCYAAPNNAKDCVWCAAALGCECPRRGEGAGHTGTE